MPIQQRNDGMVQLLGADFQKRYEPNFAFAQAIGMLQMFPGVVGIWPGSIFGGGSVNTSRLVDVSGNGLHLTRNGSTVARSSDLFPSVEYDGSTGFYEHADAAIFDILGTEGHIGAPLRGLTIGCWAYFNALGTDEGVIGKFGASGNFSYILQKLSSNNAINFRMSVDGTNLTSVASGTLTAQKLFFICGRFDPSTELKVWLNGDAVTNITSIPATIFNGNGPFNIGAYNSGSQPLAGRTGLNFLCAAAVPDVFIETFYQQSRALFGV